MSDPIDRQAAIDAWRSDFKGYVDCLDLPRDDYNGIMEYIDEAPSAQPDHLREPSRLGKIISYAVVCDKFPSPQVYFNTYDEAEHWARFNQPSYRPFYIIKRSEHFEIVGEVR